jgi:hypothetical protein
MFWHLTLMYRNGLIAEADLGAFSDELRDRILDSSRMI